MVDKLFAGRRPTPDALLLDPGCGPGAFIDGVLRWCSRHNATPPQIVGIDSDAAHAAEARLRFRSDRHVSVRNADFLQPGLENFDYIVGNPPYVAITGLSEAERSDYRRRYLTATNRFDLYALFFEQALRMLKPDGRLVFITPEKFLYVESAASLRTKLAELSVDELHFLPEDTFGDLVTYPLVTTLRRARPGATVVLTRDGAKRRVKLPSNGQSWLPAVSEAERHDGPVLADIAIRISCGVATGADREFVLADSDLDDSLRPFSHATISGRQLIPGREPVVTERMLVPYDHAGALLHERTLGALGDYLRVDRRKKALLSRTCAQRKPWYSFHETPPLSALLRPKLLCKDISRVPHFFVDRDGSIVPRHSVYYIVPADPARLDELVAYLNGHSARQWLLNHCQRAAGGFIRVQSHVLKRLPIPGEFRDQLAMQLSPRATRAVLGDVRSSDPLSADVT